MFGFIPLGLFDPVIWSEAKCIMIIAIRMKGIKKCKVKNRFNVALLIENPPHNHSTICFPTYGTAETRLVITVAPQKDICPQGRTYPRNAIAIRISRIIVPDNQVDQNL